MIGQTLNNRYKITDRLGKGAMGTVYRATDTQNNQEIALKMIASDLAIEPDMLERFKREGEALRQLKHPNIVGFIDAFQYEESYVIVMEYVSGGSLYDLLKKGALPIEQARQIALDLCDALIRAHRLDIIHRDLKPENILITEDGTPKLADFGVARLNEGTRMTRSGTQVGTPYYMAPEAWEGKTLDAQADIWSLGVVLFEMLTGQVPFGGDTGAAVMNKVLTTIPPNIKTLRIETPAEIVKIVSRMLTRDKKRRYQTMREVAVEIERGQHLKTTPVSGKIKMPRWVPTLFGIGLILAVSIIWFASQPNQQGNPIPNPTLSGGGEVIATATRTILQTSTPSKTEEANISENVLQTATPSRTKDATATGNTPQTVRPSSDTNLVATPGIQQYFTEEFDQGFENWSYFLNGGDENKFSLYTKDGGLFFDLTGRGIYSYLVYEPVKYDDVRIDVRVQNIGVNTNNITLFCRYSPEAGWYEFNMYSSGLYKILYAKPDASGVFKYSVITDGGSNEINSGKAINEYSAICEGKTLQLFINDVLTKTVDVTQYELQDGKIGFSVSSLGQIPVQVNLDWIQISKP